LQQRIQSDIKEYASTANPYNAQQSVFACFGYGYGYDMYDLLIIIINYC